MIDYPLPALLRAAHPAFQSQSSDTGDRGQGLAPEAERRYQFDRFVGQFRSRVAFERERHFLRFHPAAVVGHFDPGEPAFGNAHIDPGRPRVDRIFDQFLERRGRPFDHFAGGNAVDERLGQAADLGHRSSLAVKGSHFEAKCPINGGFPHKILAFGCTLR